jgi:hypothetical protein
MVWIQLCSNGQVLDCLFETAAFLDEFIAESITAEKALWVSGNHLSEGIKIHADLLVSAGPMIPLQGRREPAHRIDDGSSRNNAVARDTRERRAVSRLKTDVFGTANTGR